MKSTPRWARAVKVGPSLYDRTAARLTGVGLEVALESFETMYYEGHPGATRQDWLRYLYGDPSKPCAPFAIPLGRECDIDPPAVPEA